LRAHAEFLRDINSFLYVRCLARAARLGLLLRREVHCEVPSVAADYVDLPVLCTCRDPEGESGESLGDVVAGERGRFDILEPMLVGEVFRLLEADSALVLEVGFVSDEQDERI
jgi:hypothetical protein